MIKEVIEEEEEALNENSNNQRPNSPGESHSRNTNLELLLQSN